MAQGDLLSAIARGLRAGAGVLSPEVFAQNERERQLKIMKSDEGQQVITSMLLEGVQSGAIDPDRGMEALRRINPQMAEQLSGVTMGPSIAAQKQMYDAALKQQEREAIGQMAQQLGLPAEAPASLVSAAYRAKNAPQKTGSISKIAQLGEDFRAGRITRDQYEAAVRKANYIAPAGESRGDQRDRKIQALVDQGLPRSDASNIVDRNLDIQINPATGRVVLTDLVSRRVSELPVGSPGERVAVPSENTLYDMTFQGVSGLAPAVVETGSKVTGQLGGPVGERTTEYRQAIRTAEQDLVRALSVNSKFPVAEQQRIREEIAISPKVLDSDASLRARMRSIDTSLRRRLAQAERDSNDTSLPDALRSSQAQNAAAIRNFLDTLGVPQESATDDDALINKWLEQ